MGAVRSEGKEGLEEGRGSNIPPYLPLPLKMDGGHVFAPVCLFICLYAGYLSKSYGLIRPKFSGQVRCETRTNWLDFGEDPDSSIYLF